MEIYLGVRRVDAPHIQRRRSELLEHIRYLRVSADDERAQTLARVDHTRRYGGPCCERQKVGEDVVARPVLVELARYEDRVEHGLQADHGDVYARVACVVDAFYCDVVYRARETLECVSRRYIIDVHRRAYRRPVAVRRVDEHGYGRGPALAQHRVERELPSIEVQVLRLVRESAHGFVDYYPGSGYRHMFLRAVWNGVG